MSVGNELDIFLLKAAWKQLQKFAHLRVLLDGREEGFTCLKGLELCHPLHLSAPVALAMTVPLTTAGNPYFAGPITWSKLVDVTVT